MATNAWQGGAAAIAQVDVLTPGGVIAAGDIFKITINGKTLSVTATDTTVATACDLIVAAFNASTEPEFAEITAADQTTYVTLTADTAGVPFTCSVSVTDQGGSDLTFTLTSDGTGNSVLNSGPNDAAVASNWSENSVPAADAVVFEDSSVDCLYNLDQLNGGSPNLTSLTIKSTFTGKLGLPRNNANGYVEYRPTALELGTAVTAINIGQGDGSGSRRINLAIGNLTSQLDITVDKTGDRAVAGIPALLLTTGTQGNTTNLVVNRGDVGVAFNAGESAVITNLTMGHVVQINTDAKVAVGSGTTITTITKSGGELTCEANVTTLTQTGGKATFSKAATLGTGNVQNGTLYYGSSGTLTTVNVAGGGILDCRKDARSRIIANANLYEKGEIYDPAKTVSWSAGIILQQCGISDVKLDLGENVTITPS